MVPTWVPGTTLYHLHSLGATAGGGIGRIEQWLDHVNSLGCGAVLLTPVHHSSTHGYDTVDAFRLDPRLGDDDDFDRFVVACRGRGLRVVLDGVFNHVGGAFPREDWLSGRSWEGYEELRELDHDNAEVLDWASEVCRSWLDRGVDGWRFDVAYAIPRPFLRELTARVRTSHPEAFLFGEVIHGDYGELVSSTGLHSVTQYELFKAIWSALNDENLWELAWAMDRHQGFSDAFPPVTFVGNHDVTRIASVLREPEALELALAVLFTVPGVPCVYYGDELGWRGVKEHRPGGDDAIRPPLPDDVPNHPGLSQHRRWIEFRNDRPWLTTAAVEVSDKSNRTLDYRVGELTVHLDLDNGVDITGG